MEITEIWNKKDSGVLYREPLLLRANQKGVFGQSMAYPGGTIHQALFTYVCGEPDTAFFYAHKELFLGQWLVCIEVCPEEWSNRLMVTELWIDEKLRHQGLGRRLMDKAKEIAARDRRRAIMLETQSCNTNAIGFYLHEGFELIGFDTCCYTNHDIERREVRINLGYFPVNETAGKA